VTKWTGSFGFEKRRSTSFSVNQRELVNTTTHMGELWHKRMVHIHFGALGQLRHAFIWFPKFIVEIHDPFKGCAMGKYS
jgi:hypothetical protein